jgi:hypothetical protein
LDAYRRGAILLVAFLPGTAQAAKGVAAHNEAEAAG